MGKTVVCIALILSNPLLPAHRGAWQPAVVKKLAALTDRSNFFGAQARTLTTPFVVNKIRLKTTLVLTKNSLLGQWKDELQKYAPQLKVVVFHGGTKGLRTPTPTCMHTTANSKEFSWWMRLQSGIRSTTVLR